MAFVIPRFFGRLCSFDAFDSLTKDTDSFEKTIKCIVGIVEPILLLMTSKKHAALEFLSNAAKALGGLLFLKDAKPWFEGQFQRGLFVDGDFEQGLNFGKIGSTLSMPFYHIAHGLEMFNFFRWVGLVDYSAISSSIGSIPVLAPFHRLGLPGLKDVAVLIGAACGLIGVAEFLYVNRDRHLTLDEQEDMLIRFLNSAGKAAITGLSLFFRGAPKIVFTLIAIDIGLSNVAKVLIAGEKEAKANVRAGRQAHAAYEALPLDRKIADRHAFAAYAFY